MRMSETTTVSFEHVGFYLLTDSWPILHKTMLYQRSSKLKISTTPTELIQLIQTPDIKFCHAIFIQVMRQHETSSCFRVSPGAPLRRTFCIPPLGTARRVAWHCSLCGSTARCVANCDSSCSSVHLFIHETNTFCRNGQQTTSDHKTNYPR